MGKQDCKGAPCDDGIETWHVNVLVFDIQTYGIDTNFIAHPQPAEPKTGMCVVTSWQQEHQGHSAVRM